MNSLLCCFNNIMTLAGKTPAGIVFDCVLKCLYGMSTDVY